MKANEMSVEELQNEIKRMNKETEQKRRRIMDKKMAEEMRDRGMQECTGTCRFCGQMRVVWAKDPGEYSQEDLDRIASSECDCPGAEREAKRDALISDGKEAIRLTLLDRHRGHAGEVMLAGLKALASGRLKKISVQIDSETTATMFLAKVDKDVRVFVECSTTVREWSDGNQDE